MSGKNSSMISSMVNSPCINVCNGPLTDTEEGVCTGCYRTIAECEEWPRASDWRRVEILDNCKQRNNHLERMMINNKWYLMYDGSSPDGRGVAHYVGRTDDLEVARKFYDSNKDNPYWTGYVDIVSDCRIDRMR